MLGRPGRSRGGGGDKRRKQGRHPGLQELQAGAWPRLGAELPELAQTRPDLGVSRGVPAPGLGAASRGGRCCSRGSLEALSGGTLIAHRCAKSLVLALRSLGVWGRFLTGAWKSSISPSQAPLLCPSESSSSRGLPSFLTLQSPLSPFPTTHLFFFPNLLPSPC